MAQTLRSIQKYHKPTFHQTAASCTDKLCAIPAQPQAETVAAGSGWPPESPRSGLEAAIGVDRAGSGNRKFRVFALAINPRPIVAAELFRVFETQRPEQRPTGYNGLAGARI
jgi:hypothetical protein